MAIVKVVNKTYTVDPLYQWDLNQVLEIHGLSFAAAPEVHFTNAAMVRALRCYSTMDAAGIIRVNVPNTILQQAYKITALVCVRDGDVFKTYHKIEIPVKERKQPADYTIRDDDDLYSFIELENLFYEAVGTIESTVAAVNAAVTTANAASKAAQEATTGKVSRAGDTMTGALNMGGNAVKNLQAPTEDGDAVPKSYAENASNLKTGTVPVARLPVTTPQKGGTGRDNVTHGSYLVGAGGEAMEEKTPEQVLEHIGALPKAGGTMTGPLVLTEGVHYGTELPEPGIPGRIFFVVVSE